MFNAIRKQAFLLFTLVMPLALSAQSGEDKQTNQAVFNKIEYHFNLKEADSIYHLSSAAFQASTSEEVFRRTLEEQLFPLGRIRSATLQFYDEGRRIGFYQLELAGTGLLMELGVDANLRFNSINFKPYTPPAVPEKAIGTETERIEDSKEKKLMASLAREYAQQSGGRMLGIGLISNRKTDTNLYGTASLPGGNSQDSSGVGFDLGPANDLFTASLLAFLAESGQADLDAPIANYLPDSIHLNPDVAAITLKNLANHTSGLGQLPTGWNGHHTIEEFWSYMEQYQLEIPAGSVYKPSNLGYTLLTAILTHLTGMSSGEMIQEYICLPLGLQNTALIQEQGAFPDIRSPRLRTSLDDLMKFVQAHFDRPESPIQSALAMTRQFTFYHPPETDIGLAWQMQLRDTNLIYWHEGTDHESSTYIALDPDHKIGVVVLSDAGIPVNELGNRLLDALIAKK